MKGKKFLYILTLIVVTVFFTVANTKEKSTNVLTYSGNPIIKHIRSADAAAEVWNDGQVWVYASHDLDDATDYSKMDGYHVFSSYDLVNWTDHGEILHSKNVDWGIPQGGFMFAPDAAYKNGTYYLYFPHMASDWKWRVGVATSTKPEGPFTDIGRYIEGTDHIDPTCFVDDDGTAYLIWGGDSNNPKIARLKENMTELAEEPRIIEYGADNFGEGPYMHKRNGMYYFSYTCNTCYPYQGFYSMSDNPYGPFEYKGNLNPSPPGAQDHHSIIEYHNQWYYFYHVGNYNGGSLYRRNICIDSLHYNQDGTMQEIIQTKTGVGMDTIGSTPGILVPGKIEAENYFRKSGISIATENDTSSIIGSIDSNDWFSFVLEILGSEEYQTNIKISNPITGTKIYLLIDEKLADTLFVENNNDTLKTSLFLHKGKHTLKLLFENEESENDLMNVDWIDLNSETKYFAINSKASGGGKINPAGLMYLPQGDSVQLNFTPNDNFVLDSLFVDGVFVEPAENYTFNNLSENHTIEVKFIACVGVEMIPWFQINDNLPVKGTNISLTEGNNLRMYIESENSSDVLWKTPNGSTIQGNEFVLSTIKNKESGFYSVFIIDSTNCKNELMYEILVNYLQLDVYEAENWSYQSGVQLANSTDLGGGKQLTSIENNDLCFYRINIETPGYYALTARVATANEGGVIEVSNAQGVIAAIPVSRNYSNNWDEWYTTVPVEVEFGQGIQNLKFTFKGNSGQLFNFNWFDLEFLRPTKTKETKNAELTLNCYTSRNNEIIIDYQLSNTEEININVYNVHGKHIKTIENNKVINSGIHKKTWNGCNENGERVTSGIYMLVLKTNNKTSTRKIAVFKQ